MVRLPHVVLMVETAGIYGRRILSGFSCYLNSHRPWSIFVENHAVGGALPRWLTNWRGDGLICRSLTAQSAERLRGLNVPVVNLNDFWSDPWLPLIRSDDLAIGQLAAEHLRQRCFRHFAFCGFSDLEWSRRRREGFRTALLGTEAYWGEYDLSWGGRRSHSWEQEQSETGRWLQSLPKPLGVLACCDERGRHIVDACQRAKPEEVAVIGVDDDVLLCELCNPPLSSVVPNPERIGYEAALLLDRLMSGDRPRRQEWLIPPLGVVTRQSTDVLAIDDPDLVAAVSYIREQACLGTSVREVLERVSLSRTILERKFRKHLGHSLQAEIRAVQLRRVKQLLAETSLPLDRIAALAGYKHPEYMSVVFKRDTGQTPGHYRRQAQSGSLLGTGKLHAKECPPE
jgi:LacI family transcriptional regulator